MSKHPAEKIALLQIGRLTDLAEARLREEYAVTSLWEQADRDSFLAREGARFKALVTAGGTKVSAALIAALPTLQVVSTRGVGTDHIDLAATQERGIVVSNTPDVLTDCVADLAFGALLAVVRRMLEADRFVRRGAWLNGRFPLTTRVSGKGLGIVGLGRIGLAIARRAGGFGMEVRYHSRSLNPERPAGYCSSLQQLAEWADFLVVCVPGGAETRRLVSAEVLKALGPKGYLVNISRGSVVDEAALIAALDAGSLAGAALDVFEHEPRVPDALLAQDKVLLLPHIASSTRETFADMENLLLDNLRSYFASGQLLTPVIED